MKRAKWMERADTRDKGDDWIRTKKWRNNATSQRTFVKKRFWRKYRHSRAQIKKNMGIVLASVQGTYDNHFPKPGENQRGKKTTSNIDSSEDRRSNNARHKVRDFYPIIQPSP